VGGSDDDGGIPTLVFPPSSCSLPHLDEGDNFAGTFGLSLSILEGRLEACGGLDMDMRERALCTEEEKEEEEEDDDDDDEDGDGDSEDGEEVEKGGCGGMDDSYKPRSSCLSWSPGAPSWRSSYTMREARSGHLAWTPPTRPGTLLLLGGGSRSTSTTGEEVPGGATFTLPHEVFYSCGIEDGDTFIITGGGSSYVTRFGPTGAVEEELPRLPEARFDHGCGHYPTGAGQALLVAGGGTTDYTSSVLTLLPSATSWTPLSPLPRRLVALASSMVGGRLWLVGGRDSDSNTKRAEVLQYEPSMDTWTPKGNITGARSYHGMVAVGPQDLPCLRSSYSN